MSDSVLGSLSSSASSRLGKPKEATAFTAQCYRNRRCFLPLISTNSFVPLQLRPQQERHHRLPQSHAIFPSLRWFRHPNPTPLNYLCRWRQILIFSVINRTEFIWGLERRILKCSLMSPVKRRMRLGRWFVSTSGRSSRSLIRRIRVSLAAGIRFLLFYQFLCRLQLRSIDSW